MPEVGVDARDEAILDSGACPLAPLTLECTEDGFFDPQAIGVEDGAGAFSPPPKEGKASSECVLREGKPLASTFGEAEAGPPIAFCFPAAFSDRGFAKSTGAEADSGFGAACNEGGGWTRSSSSRTSSTVGL